MAKRIELNESIRTTDLAHDFRGMRLRSKKNKDLSFFDVQPSTARLEI